MTHALFSTRQEITNESRAKAWGERNKKTAAENRARAKEAWELICALVASGYTGDRAGWLAEHSGEPRTTCHRAIKMGEFLAMGGNPDVSQADALDAMRAVSNGASVDEANAAVEAAKTNARAVRDLANGSEFGTVFRQMTTEGAELSEKAREKVGRLGLDGLTPMERDAFIYAMVLEMPDTALARVVKLYRKTVENTPLLDERAAGEA